MKITEATINVQTGEETITERDATATEKKQIEKNRADNATAQAEAEAKTAQRQVILDRLGLTADEAQLLLG